jgi:hypothetical protein
MWRERLTLRRKDVERSIQEKIGKGEDLGTFKSRKFA